MTLDTSVLFWDQWRAAYPSLCQNETTRILRCPPEIFLFKNTLCLLTRQTARVAHTTIYIQSQVRRCVIRLAVRFSDKPPGIVHTSDKRSRTLALNVVNFSFHTAPLAAQDGILLSYNVPNQSYETDWRRQVEEFRQQFDLDYDLNGAAMAKIWGLASFRGWIAACFSVHPTGQFEHYTISQHYVRLVFARPFLGTEDESSEADGFSPWQGAKHDPVTQDNGRAVILAFILDPANRETSRNYPSRYKILYAAACCVLVQPVLHSGYLPAAKSAIEFIRDQTRITFATELSLIEETEKNLIAEEAHSLATTGRQTRLRMPAKSQGELSAPGALDVFEICLICGCGMEWYSATESQCAAGHIFRKYSPSNVPLLCHEAQAC